MILTALQMRSVPDVLENLATIDTELAKLPSGDNHLVLLPECCLYFGGSDKSQLAIAEKLDAPSMMINGLKKLALKYRINLVAGTIPLVSAKPQKFTASSLCINEQGEVLGEYQKIHLFDVVVEDGTGNYQESRFTQAGSSIQCLDLGWCKVGMTVCYDLRFPELFRQLRNKGADVIVVPAAFTERTGMAHWQPLLQARAIENQVYIVAAGQQGEHQNGRRTWGHSMIIDPWGEIKSQLSSGIGTLSAELDFNLLKKVRRDIPVETHNRFNVGINE